MDNLKKHLSKIEGGKVLDVGTGRGEFVNLLKDSLKDYTEIIGIDYTEQSIKYCENHFNEEKINFIKMDASQMDFPDNSFDTVCISNSLHHLPDIDPILKEMKRVLKPNGLFIVTEMFCDNQTNAQMSHVLIHHWSSKIDSALGTYHDETFKRNEIIEIFNSLDLRDTIIFDFEFENEDPKSPEVINYFNDAIDKVVERVNNHENYLDLKAEGEKIKEWIQQYGFHSATELFLMGEK